MGHFYSLRSREVLGLNGPLLFLGGGVRCGYGELVKVVSEGGEVRFGQVIQVDEDLVVIQVFEGCFGLSVPGTEVVFEREVFRVGLCEDLVGRTFDGRGRPIDGLGPVVPERLEPVVGSPINPAQRVTPSDFIETGFSAVDLMNTLVKGQKLPVFAGGGLPAAEIAASMVLSSRVREGDFLVVLAAMGISSREAQFFQRRLSEEGASRFVFFLNLASDPASERLLTPRCALTVAEYFAFELGYDVLVILIDMLNYCEALREISAAREEVPGRRGYPGYLYSDLSTIYERAGCLKGRKGTLTQVPIVTMPADDMTHPVVDLTGYITEGQVVLSRRLHSAGVYPPIDVLPSLSRLMNKGIGRGKTFPEHRALADQLYACYAQAKDLERLVAVIGEEGLTEVERSYLRFGKAFEERFLSQRGRRSLEESVQAAWECLRILPKSELVKLPKHYLEARY